MRLASFIAGRYLFAKKSHNVINIISAISAIGMAIGTAALIIILSVYNGFDSLIRSMLGNVEPDLLITPATGKVFVPEGGTYDWIYDQPEVKNMCGVLQEQVFINYDGQQGLAKAKGVDWIYEEETQLRDNIRDGEFKLHRGDIPLAAIGAGLAYSMGINPRFVSPIEIYFPSRTRKLSMSNPISSIETIKVWPSCTFSINNDV
ncbi:MAG: ABC transporter permease, partial [Bacteroidales bacterium]|nr:ABC transporter permease [Bacteroidales bacterium]